MRYMKVLKSMDDVIALFIITLLCFGYEYINNEIFVLLMLSLLSIYGYKKISNNVYAIVDAPPMNKTIPNAKGLRLGFSTSEPLKKRKAIIIGAGSVGQALAESLEKRGYDIVGFIDDIGVDTVFDSRWQVIGSRDNVDEVIQTNDIDEVFVAYAPTWQQELANKLALHNRHIDVKVVPSPYEAMLSSASVTHYGDVAVVPLAIQVNHGYLNVKRFFDIVASLIILLLTLPLIVVTSILIKLTSKGPIIFKQERTGLHGNTFLMYKFRTMVVNAEDITGPIRSPGKADMRLTKIGRILRLCRIDELPQLINVFKGEMSIVGPRPERPCFTAEYQRITPLYARRHDVLPGITGLAQICGGYHTDARDKLRFDLIYAANLSLWLDIEILLRTLFIVVCPRQQEFESAHAIR